ncbi:MAG: hypothetical protein D6790_06635 [Caldilineae bacterium]|nr:MAG: hypothetical protein D6790_06635 [Caldilineae bacterium]
MTAGLGVSLLVRLPGAFLTFNVFGSPVTVPFTRTTLMAGLLVLLTAAAAERTVRIHPLVRRAEPGLIETGVYWGLPAAIAILAVLLTPQFPSRLFQMLGILFSGVLMAVVLYALYGSVDPGAPGFRRSRIFLNLLAYGAALALFLLVYRTRARSLVSGTEVALTAMLLAVELLRSTTGRTDLVLSYAGIIGLVLGEITWALNYLVLPGLTGSLLLLLIFYLFVGLAQQSLQGRLSRRVVAEFALFALFALILISIVGPGF